ncbi:hypothetical protein [Desulforamulus reducens]|uniref:hypothetical protein n=1 Tax=Desulforamulus reducens TaxID=59610 RepID=UPI000316D27C|nr:hypothetical protein [Desulforamulus reducens]
MGYFFDYAPPKKDMEIAKELQPQPKRINLISPQEWTYCQKERDLASFAKRNKKH